MIGFTRQLYTHLLDWKQASNRKPLILYGVRQCGKSFLVREQFGPSEYPVVHVFDFKEHTAALQEIFASDYDVTRIIRQLAIFSGKDINLTLDLIVFDEVQECLAAIESLKYFYERVPDCHVIALGSMLRVKLSGDFQPEPADKKSTHLFSFPVGKVDELNLFPMNFNEFLCASGDDKAIEIYLSGDRSLIAHKKLLAYYLDYLFVGGMPEAVAGWFERDPPGNSEPINAKIAKVRKIHHALIGGYKKDFVLKGNVVDGSHLAYVYDAVFTQINLQMIIDDSIKRFKFKDVIAGKPRFEQLRGVIDWLTLAGLVHKIFVISSNPMQSPESFIRHNIFKIIPHDVGLLNAKLNHSYKDLTLGRLGLLKGPIGEVFVGCELQSTFCTTNSTPLMAWSDEKSQYEIEFLLHHAIHGTYPLEVKSGEHVKSRSLLKYKEFYHPTHTVKLSARPGGLRDTSDHLLPIYFAARHQDFL